MRLPTAVASTVLWKGGGSLTVFVNFCGDLKLPCESTGSGNFQKAHTQFCPSRMSSSHTGGTTRAQAVLLTRPNVSVNLDMLQLRAGGNVSGEVSLHRTASGKLLEPHLSEDV